SRRHDVYRAAAPALKRELRILAGCVVHAARFRCANGIVLAAHSWGRTREAWDPVPAPAAPGVDDFLSGRSGTVGGLRGRGRQVRDGLADLWTRPARTRARRDAVTTAHASASRPPRVLVLGVERPGSLMPQALEELRRSESAELTIAAGPGRPGAGKFENLNEQLAPQDLDGFDWLLILDDDVRLPPAFLDVLLDQATRHELKLAQPAHRLHSHAAWPVTRRDGAGTRRTTFVEIGPVTLFHRDTFAALLPFPAQLRMGWGLDAHWAALAREHGWALGVVDAVPIGHTVAPAGAGYSREQALAEARAFLAGRPYVTRDEVRAL
ncbi:MAG: hypothetical protein JWM31_761, partial [Solirubrobacterales bacterium]|nr:hypothetical protein [Solirubrobacterales bacterium]